MWPFKRSCTAYWWANAVNLGDQLTPLIIERRYGRKCRHAHAGISDMLATGSIMANAFLDDVRTRKTPLHVVGAGIMDPSQELGANGGIRIHSVRGRESAKLLEDTGYYSNLLLGDPGLLVPKIARQTAPTVSATYGVIVHYVLAEDKALRDRLTSVLGDVVFLDVRTADIDQFVADMRGCDVILSHSLHGLIMADALGIPNLWLNLGGLSGGIFKFTDYFSSIDRPIEKRLDAIPTNESEIIPHIYHAESDAIEFLQDSIDEAFMSAFAELDRGRFADMDDSELGLLGNLLNQQQDSSSPLVVSQQGVTVSTRELVAFPTSRAWKRASTYGRACILAEKLARSAR